MLMTSLYNRKYKICFMLYIKTFNNNSIKQLINDLSLPRYYNARAIRHAFQLFLRPFVGFFLIEAAVFYSAS